ncbi:hypothetical protein [Sporomusa aerivorans]|uniref:hypothetical protein n=1 Tax=Sporomusa aerivorans TaxID=204936 RepID=UPI00352A5CD4
MILKVISAQPVCNNYKQNFRYQSKEGLNKKSSTSFANVLESTIKAKCADLKLPGTLSW